jgi:heavy metal translocating P-type ATPase
VAQADGPHEQEAQDENVLSSPRVLAGLQLGALLAGAAFALSGALHAAELVWAVAIVAALLPLSWSVTRRLARGDVGVDVIALLAMVGALILGQELAGVVIALMLAGGNALEDAARRRARCELEALLERAPRIAHRRRDGLLEEVSVDALRPGDLVAVRPGEVVPVDGVVEAGVAVLDEAALTGESLPVNRGTGEPVRSGSANAGGAFDLRASCTVANSAYSGLVRLVRDAHAERAPFVRMADRYAAWFLPLTLLVAGAAWALEGDPLRALAVLVVATPCPLILAAPIAIVSGMSRAARRGVIVKDGGTIERLGRARSVLVDKTGTLTLGVPDVDRIVALDGLAGGEVLRLAASVDQLSAHVLAEALVHDAETRGLRLELPERFTERPGQGVEGRVGVRSVAVGSAAWLRERGYPDPRPALTGVADGAPGHARVLVGVDGVLAGVLLMGDRLRDDARPTLEGLREAGIREVLLVTGDRRSVADAVGRQAGVDSVLAEQEPEDKLRVVRALKADPERSPVIMVGDGINDAPALALADVGVAMGLAGATISAEAADAVIVVDRLDRLAEAVRIGRRALRIARQSVLVGMGLSLGAMALAFGGVLSPLAGAVLQEGIDVAVILNALRARRG